MQKGLHGPFSSSQYVRTVVKNLWNKTISEDQYYVIKLEAASQGGDADDVGIITGQS